MGLAPLADKWTVEVSMMTMIPVMAVPRVDRVPFDLQRRMVDVIAATSCRLGSVGRPAFRSKPHQKSISNNIKDRNGKDVVFYRGKDWQL
jgi:hypothetical protein